MITVLNSKKAKLSFSIFTGCLILIALAAVVLYVVLIKDNTTTNENNTTVPVQSQEEIEQRQKSSNAYLDIISLTAEQDYEQLLPTARIFAEDAKNGVIPRLSAYLSCMEAADFLKNQEAKDGCYAASKQLTPELIDQELIDAWMGYLTDAYNGLVEESTDDIIQ
jgi:hypothetical protein